jgi:hypothetical protein
MGLLYGGMKLGWVPPVQKGSFLVSLSESSLVKEVVFLKPYARMLKLSAVETVFTPAGDVSLEAPVGADGVPKTLSRHVQREGTLKWGFPPGIFVYSAFAGSAMFWLFGLGWLGWRLTLWLGKGRGSPPGGGRSETAPFRFLGAMTMMVATGCFLVGFPLFF